jgi:hypothetical protein
MRRRSSGEGEPRPCAQACTRNYWGKGNARAQPDNHQGANGRHGQAIKDCDQAACGHDGVDGKKAVRRGQPKGGRTWGGRERRGKLLYVRKYQDRRCRLARPVPNHNKQQQATREEERKGGGRRSYRRGPGWLDHRRRMASMGPCHGISAPAPAPCPCQANPRSAPAGISLSWVLRQPRRDGTIARPLAAGRPEPAAAPSLA